MSDSRRQFTEQPYVHFVTFGCDRRRRLLDHDHPKKILLGSLGHQLTLRNATCCGFVIMPDHVHALLHLALPNELPLFMHEWKRLSSHAIRKWYRDGDPEYFRGVAATERFWTPKYHHFEVESAGKLREKLEYMHLNPVRVGLCLRAVDWRWSSARWYELRKPVGVPIHWPA